MKSEEGCTTKTTAKKGEGFVPYNRHGIKWGQIDTKENHFRLVFDLKSGSLSERRFNDRTGLSITPPRKLLTGYRYTVSNDDKGHDQLILFLKDAFLTEETETLNDILIYAKEFVAQSGFKSQPSR